MARWSSTVSRTPAERRAPQRYARMAGRELSVLLESVATALVVIAGFALTLVFAATLAVVLVLAVGLLVLATLAWRVRPRAAAVKTGRTGHAWVACRWDDRSR